MIPVRRINAFTLIEMLVVVALLGLIATIVTVRLNSTTAIVQLRSAKIILEQTIAQAKFEALMNRMGRSLEFDRSRGSVRIAAESLPKDARAWRMLDGVQIRSIEVATGSEADWRSVDSIRFTPAGISAAWRIHLESGKTRSMLFCDGWASSFSDAEGGTVR